MPAADGAPVAVLRKTGRLAFGAKVGAWYRVEKGSEVLGWVSATAPLKLGAAGGSIEEPGPGVLEYSPLRRPPSIAIDEDVGIGVVDAATVKLSGSVKAQQLKDVYVLVND